MGRARRARAPSTPRYPPRVPQLRGCRNGAAAPHPLLATASQALGAAPRRSSSTARYPSSPIAETRGSDSAVRSGRLGHQLPLPSRLPTHPPTHHRASPVGEDRRTVSTTEAPPPDLRRPPGAGSPGAPSAPPTAPTASPLPRPGKGGARRRAGRKGTVSRPALLRHAPVSERRPAGAMVYRGSAQPLGAGLPPRLLGGGERAMEAA